VSNLEISLDGIAQQLKDDNNITIQEAIDEVYSIVLSGTQLAGLLSGFSVPSIIENFKPSEYINKFMPKKYLNKTREDTAKEKFEKLKISHFSIILLSINQAIKESESEFYEMIEKLHKEEPQLFEDDIKEFKKNNLSIVCKIPQKDETNINKFISSFLNSINPIMEIYAEKIGITGMSHMNSYNDFVNTNISKMKEDAYKNYQINLLEMATEFPEVKLWVDLNFQKNIVEQNDDIKELVLDIKHYQQNNFIKDYGFNNLENTIKKNNFIIGKLQNSIDGNIWRNINVHHNYIKHSTSKKLVEEQGLEELNLPSKSEIFVPQSFKYFYYQDTKHKKNFIDEKIWKEEQYFERENIGKSLFQALQDPYNMNQPIIILGHPGAGKSMLSSMFASKLVQSNDFVPFFIRLRDVDSSNSKVDIHIKEGILNTLVGVSDINWIEWIEKFPNRIPVFILDGFDELLRSTQTALNNYLMDIKELQERLLYTHGISTRIIITSRLTIMEKVKIPNNSLIIKLNSFDEKRQQLWIDKWNERGINNQFILPKHSDIQELAKEPLLLFLLAVYDSDDNALSKLLDKDISRSNLYDKLFERFTIRQLMKDPKFDDLDNEQQKILTENFRLKIGYFAQILFLHNRTHHYEKDFDIELNDFDLNEDKAKNILNGFFFIHEDKSTNTHKEENFSFEFLHKTFGEFLASDFMLRIAKYKTQKNSDFFDEKYFRQTFAFQWINKQPKTLDFLLEHAPTILNDDRTKEKLVEFIQDELLSIFNEKNILPLPERLHKFKTFEKFNHFAIYSQNLILLWLAIEQKSFEFNISNKINNIQAWKIFVDLWKNYGDYENVSYLTKYIDIESTDKYIKITPKNVKEKNISDFMGYTLIKDCEYEIILSMNNSNFSFDDLEKLLNSTNKDIQSPLAQLICSKLEYIYGLNHKIFNEKLFFRLLNNILDEKYYIYLIEFYITKELFYQFQHNDMTKELFEISQNFSSPLYIYKFIKMSKDIFSKKLLYKLFEILLSKDDLFQKLSNLEIIDLLNISLRIDFHLFYLIIEQKHISYFTQNFNDYQKLNILNILSKTPKEKLNISFFQNIVHSIDIEDFNISNLYSYMKSVYRIDKNYEVIIHLGRKIVFNQKDNFLDLENKKLFFLSEIFLNINDKSTANIILTKIKNKKRLNNEEHIKVVELFVLLGEKDIAKEIMNKYLTQNTILHEIIEIK